MCDNEGRMDEVMECGRRCGLIAAILRSSVSDWMSEFWIKIRVQLVKATVKSLIFI